MSEQAPHPAPAATAAGVTLARFNELDPVDAAALVRPCLDVDRWVEAVVNGRPYADVPALREVAAKAASTFTGEELEAALAHHPRIGEGAKGGSQEAQLSRGEQSGLRVDDDLGERLRQGNADYERRFGRIPEQARARLAAAADRADRVVLVRPEPEILSALESRLGNDEATEDQVVGEQLGQIAVVRLVGLVTP